MEEDILTDDDSSSDHSKSSGRPPSYSYIGDQGCSKPLLAQVFHRSEESTILDHTSPDISAQLGNNFKRSLCLHYDCASQSSLSSNVCQSENSNRNCQSELKLGWSPVFLCQKGCIYPLRCQHQSELGYEKFETHFPIPDDFITQDKEISLPKNSKSGQWKQVSETSRFPTFSTYITGQTPSASSPVYSQIAEFGEILKNSRTVSSPQKETSISEKCIISPEAVEFISHLADPSDSSRFEKGIKNSGSGYSSTDLQSASADHLTDLGLQGFSRARLKEAFERGKEFLKSKFKNCRERLPKLKTVILAKGNNFGGRRFEKQQKGIQEDIKEETTLDQFVTSVSMTKVASSDNAVSNKIMKPDTGGSDGPNKESGADQRRDQNGSGVKDTCEENDDPFEESPNPKAPECIDSQRSLDDEESSQIEAEAIDAELPVGVDAVSLGQSSVRFRDQIPDHKRDGQLAMYEQNGVQIGPVNKRVQWVQSMEKSKESSSNSSGSVEMILQDREMDPEDVLKSLGFCGKEDETDTSFARVPDRFFLTSSAARGIDQVRIVWDHPEIHHLIPLMQRKENQQHLTEVNGPKTEEVKGARGAWGRAKAKSFSSVLQGMKFLSMFHSPYQHQPVVNPAYRPVQHIPPQEGMEDVPTILELPNFQFLAKQGFYRQVPSTKSMDFKSNESVQPNVSEKPKTLSAAQKRKQFSRSCRSKWSLTSPDEEEEMEKNAEREVTFDDSTESKEKSASVQQTKNVLDLRSFSIGISEDSVDSNESLSLTTPSTPSPRMTTSTKESKFKRQSTIQEIRKNLQESRKTIPDSSNGNRSSVVETSLISNQGISDLRKNQVEKLMTSEIDDGDYKVDDVKSKTCAASPDLIKASTANNKDTPQTSGNMAVSTERINIKNRMMFKEKDLFECRLLSVEETHLIMCRSESSHTLVPTDFSVDEEIEDLQNQGQAKENDESFFPNDANGYGESEVKETAKGTQMCKGSLKQLDVNLKIHPQESYELEEMLEPLTDEQQGLLDKFPHGIRGALEKTASMQSDSSGFADADLSDNKNGNRETSPVSNTPVDYIVPQTNNNNNIVQTYNHQTCVCKTQVTDTREKHKTIATDQSSGSRGQCHIHGTKDCQEHKKKEYSGQCPSLHSITYDRSHPATPVTPGKSAKNPGALLYTINLPITYTKADETSMDITGEVSSENNKTLKNLVPEISVTPPNYFSQIHIEINKDSQPVKTPDNCLNIVKSAYSVPEGTQHQESISSQTGPNCARFRKLGFSNSQNSQYPETTRTQNYRHKQTVMDDVVTSEKSLYSRVTPSKERQPLSMSTPVLNNCGQDSFEDTTISNMTDDWLPREHVDSHMYNLNIMSAGTVSSYSLTTLEYPPQQRNVPAFDKGPVLRDASLDYQKLIKLVNQPPTTNLEVVQLCTVYFQSERRVHLYYIAQMITLGGKIPTLKYHHRHYHKKLHLTERRKWLEEESLLVQHALQKYKLELTFMETAFFHTYQTAYEELSEEERAEVEDLQMLWCELKKEILEMEQLISSRLSGICAGNENFLPLDTLKVVNQMINLLREQLYQQQIMICHDSFLDNDEEYETISNRSSVSMTSVSSAGQIWPDLSQQISEMKEQLTKSRSSLSQEMEETLSGLKTTILNEVKQELHGSSRQLQEELKSKDQEIQRLRLELLKNSIDQGMTRKRETFESDV